MKIQKSSLEISHFPVMLGEVLKISDPEKGGIFIDCTFGGGGYSKALLNFPRTRVIGIDRDSKVTSLARTLENKFQKRFKFFKLKFSELDKTTKNSREVDTIIFDLGLSSIQLNDLKRGFSFRSKEKLDMSMGLSDISAQEVVNNLSETKLKLIIKTFGEERDAAKIAKNIVKARAEKKITRVDELVSIIKKSKKITYTSKINPSTKTFQALRIFVNKETTELINGVIKATKLLKPGGKILVVSFHSIEDKIIKYFFSNFSQNRSKPSRYLPEEQNTNLVLFEKYYNKIITASKNELNKNNSSRSAKLRFAIRNKNEFFFPNNFVQKFKKYLQLEANDDQD